MERGNGQLKRKRYNLYFSGLYGYKAIQTNWADR